MKNHKIKWLSFSNDVSDLNKTVQTIFARKHQLDSHVSKKLWNIYHQKCILEESKIYSLKMMMNAVSLSVSREYFSISQFSG